jgi:hypothetical protein
MGMNEPGHLAPAARLTPRPDNRRDKRGPAELPPTSYAARRMSNQAIILD